MTPAARRFLVGSFTLAALAASASMASAVQAASADTPDLDRVHAIPGLTPAQQAAFERGRQLYEKDFMPAEGLGPLFNQTSCRSCHGLPYTGGSSVEVATLVNGFSDQGENLSLKEQGGLMIQNHAIAGIPLEQLPKDARYISKRISPPTFGLGLIEAIPTTAITAQLAANPVNHALGIRGRANWEFEEIGRFGWKAQKGDMVDFTQQACQFELGLSTPGRPQKHFPNLPPQKLGKPALYNDARYPYVKQYFDQRAANGLPMDKPDLQQPQLEDLIAFQRYQAPVSPLPAVGIAKHGQQLFKGIHCDACHVQSFTTGPNTVGVPAGLKVQAFSDLLVHDMGAGDADGLVQGVAKGSQWRTPPLWGLRYREKLMHDGRTSSMHECLEEHGGEGARVTALYDALKPEEKRALLAYLKTL